MSAVLLYFADWILFGMKKLLLYFLPHVADLFVAKVFSTIEEAVPAMGPSVGVVRQYWEFGETLFPLSVAFTLLVSFVGIWATWFTLKTVWKFIPTLSW